ncbi:MAG: hypothetical protein JSU65_12905 [Candidatus Zixiibacteriota bacterium]|nr:MAG: hypothetical protein JSU65_12905 [candidate division Zixibacteria bacterium]
MSIQESRTKEQIFATMHRELRRWNPAIPESVERLDPMLKILLELYAHQLESIDQRIDRTWEVAANSLIKSLSPESHKWPVPAYTIMRCLSNDPAVEIDPHTRFFYKEEREGGKTFFFSSQRTEKLVSAEVRLMFLRFGDMILDISPPTDGTDPSRREEQTPGRGAGQIYLGVEYAGMPSNLKDTTLFINGPDTVMRQIRWGYWYPGSNFGEFFEDSGFCPGLTTDIETVLADGGQSLDWGGLRSSHDLFSQLENSFVVLPEKFTSTWELGPADELLTGAIEERSIENDRFYWIRIDLPSGGDKAQLLREFGVYFNCFVATNKNELSTYKYTGGNRLVEVEIPEPADTVLEITRVVDSNRDEYIPRHKLSADRSQQSYTLDEKNNHLTLWFDYTSRLEPPPDNITVNYTVTSGTAANGIAAGKIVELYEKHPGVTGAENLTPTRGAIPARTEKQLIAEASLRLRNRDRVVNFAEIAAWTKTFDPRLGTVKCENSVERAARGVRRCILVRVQVSSEDFYSDDEVSLLQTRLKRFLKSRSPVNTNYRIEVIRK